MFASGSHEKSNGQVPGLVLGFLIMIIFIYEYTYRHANTIVKKMEYFCWFFAPGVTDRRPGTIK